MKSALDATEIAKLAGFLRRPRREAIDQGPRPTHVALLVEGQGVRCTPAPALLFQQENGQTAEEREVLGRGVVARPTAIFVLRAIPSVMLAILNGPMTAHEVKDLPGRGFVLPQAAGGMARIPGSFPDLPLAHVFPGGVDAQQTPGARQAQVGRIDPAMPEAVSGDPPMVFLSPLQ